MKKILHPWLALPVRVALGGLLLWASWHKIADPPEFANIVYNYKLFPAQAINLIAIYMPWLEVFTGLALISGLGRRAASLLTAALMAAFIAAISYNLSRDCPIVCGCFSSAGSELSDTEKFAAMRLDIWRDAGMLLMALHVFVASIVKRQG